MCTLFLPFNRILKAGSWPFKIQEKDIIDEPIYFYNRNSRSAEFYLQKRLDVVSWNDILSNQYHKKSAWYYMSLDGKESLLHYGFQVDEEIALTHYGMNRLELGFLNPKTREEYLEPRYLIRFKKEKRTNPIFDRLKA
jgi:hypothetical protein